MKPAQAEHDHISVTLDRKNPEFGAARDSCFLVRWLSLYTFIPLLRSFARPLAKYDLANLSKDIHPARNHQDYQSLKSAARSEDRLDLFRLLFGRLLLWEFIISGLLTIVVAGLAFSGPFVIEKILTFLNQSGATVEQQEQAYMYAGIWIGLYLVRIFVNAYCERRLMFTATKAQQILTVELLEKITRLAPSYRMDNERSRGQLLNILTEDIAAVSSFLTTSSILFSAPATLIGVQIFLFLTVGFYGFALFFILIVAGVAQVLLRRRILAANAGKHALMELRVLTNLEIFHSIESIKLMGWEKLIKEKNMLYRRQENILNQRYYRYIYIFDLVINLVPVLTVFFIFILLSIKDQNIDTVVVYTVLSYVGLTYDPVKSLLGAITNAVEGVNSMREISKFLQYREIPDVRIQDSTLEAGTLSINNLIASWHPYAKERGEPKDALDSARLNKSVSISLSSWSLTERLLQDKNREESEIKPKENETPQYDEVRKTVKFALGIPMKIELKRGQRLILISKPQAGKSTLFHALIGNLYIISGTVRFGGRIGYLPQRLWFRNESIRQNVLFGLSYDWKKLNFVYRMVLLKEDLKNFERGDRTVMDASSGLTEGQKRRIALARVLYSEPDLMLLDEVFAGLDPQTTQQIYQNLCTNYRNCSILLSTHVTNFIRKEDRLMILKDGVVVTSGTMGQLSQSPHLKMPECPQNEVGASEEQRLKQSQLLQKQQRMFGLRHRLQAFVKGLISSTKGMTKQQIQHNIFRQAEKRKSERLQARSESHRIELDTENYRRFIRLAPFALHITLFLLSILTQATRIFADWWIGSVENLPWPLDQNQALYVYIGLTAAFGIFFVLCGVLSVHLSAKSASTLTKTLCDSIAYASLDWHSKTNYIKVAELANRDDAEIFGITNAAYSLFRDTLTFLATIVLVGITSPIFLALAAGAIALDLAIFYVYGRAVVEMDVFDDMYHDPLMRTYEQLINGIDLLRAFGKLTNPRNSIVEQCYNYTVYKVNRKFLDMSMSLLTEIISLSIIAGAAFFAVRSKLNSDGSEQNMAVIGTSIAISIKITGLVTGVSWGVATVKSGIIDNIEKAHTIIGKQRQEGYDEPSPPIGWPKDSSIELDKVTLVYPKAMVTAANMVSLRINACEKIFMTGKSASGKGSIQKAIAKILLPVRNIDLSLGSIKIGGVDLKRIGRRFITQHICLIGAVPFMFTGTLRENIDPFGMHSDESIKKSLELVGAWNFLIRKNTIIDRQGNENMQERLDQTISNAGYYMSLGLLQQINIARAVLSKPKVLLWDTAASSLDQATEGDLLGKIVKVLSETTLIVISQKLTTAMKMDKVIYMSNGRVKEYDRPRALLRKKQSNPFRKMVENSQAAHKVMKILDAIDQE